MGPAACPTSKMVPKVPMAVPKWRSWQISATRAAVEEVTRASPSPKNSGGDQEQVKVVQQGNGPKRQGAQHHARIDQGSASVAVGSPAHEGFGEDGHQDLHPPEETRLELVQSRHLHGIDGQEGFQRAHRQVLQALHGGGDHHPPVAEHFLDAGGETAQGFLQTLLRSTVSWPRKTIRARARERKPAAPLTR